MRPEEGLYLQLLSADGYPSLFSATDSTSPYWRLVRKGTGPAFQPNNLRCELWE